MKVHTKTLISVIVPVYNASKTLDRCVQSILKQTYSNIELLLVNDGSDDCSGSICNSYAEKDKRVIVFHKENGGVSSARNLGLENANGEYVTFCDADDYVQGEWLESFVSNSEGVDIVCQGVTFDYSLMQNVEVASNKTLAFEYEGDMLDGLDKLHEYGLIGYVFLKLFKRSIIEEHNLRFDESYNYMEDEDFSIRYMRHCSKMISLPEANYHYYYLGAQHLEKYVVKNRFNLFKSLYLSSILIYTSRHSPVIDYYIENLTMALMEKAKMGDLTVADVRVYRRILGRRVLSTNLFLVTKWAVFGDYWGYVSRYFILLHNKIKRYL